MRWAACFVVIGCAVAKVTGKQCATLHDYGKESQVKPALISSGFFLPKQFQ
jgi:hypothetical protein